ncbi:MAG: dTDP-4-dehydrorhamnose reductase [Gammaproteobacteria bacterium]|nr:dTDP-4-dehydrorhamnose reductase [Gammaproteobacteria bacterium]MDP2348954.1 dTDP-4-dehydrorhamnose reductase [Gammaproteobacteria bacterium]
MVKRIAITGANGQLGQTLIRSGFAELHMLLPLGREELDITDPASVAATLDSLKPDFIINAAAYTAVDAAETHAAEAYAINEQGVKHLARWAKGKPVHLIHVSTDFVFGGEKNRPYQVDDPVSPISVYGQSKLAGEKMLATLLPGKATIVRTAWLYSPWNTNFVKTMLRLMKERDVLHIVDDQIGTPCSTASLVGCLQVVVNRNKPGSIYHWTDAGVASWYDFAVAIQEEALALSLLDRAIPVNPIPTAKYPTPAKRPAYSVLDKSKALVELGCPQVHWREALRAVLKQLSER